MSGRGLKVLYISGEESERQIKMRGERLGIAATNLYFCRRRIWNSSLTRLSVTNRARLSLTRFKPLLRED